MAWRSPSTMSFGVIAPAAPAAAELLPLPLPLPRVTGPASRSSFSSAFLVLNTFCRGKGRQRVSVFREEQAGRVSLIQRKVA